MKHNPWNFHRIQGLGQKYMVDTWYNVPGQSWIEIWGVNLFKTFPKSQTLRGRVCLLMKISCLLIHFKIKVAWRLTI